MFSRLFPQLRLVIGLRKQGTVLVIIGSITAAKRVCARSLERAGGTKN